MSVDVVRGERRGVMGAQGGKRKPFRVTAFLSSCAVAVVALVFAFPILWMFLSAFKSTRSIVEDAFPLSWKSFVPAHPVLDNFVHLFTQLGFAQNFLNTVIVSVCQVALTVVVATLAGYALSRLNFRGRELVFVLCLVGAFVPVEAMVIPMYSIAKGLGLMSTYQGIFLPFGFSPFAIYLMRQSFRSLPMATFESAQLDGAGQWKSFWHVGLPGVRPALASLILIQFIGSWSNYFWPLVAMQDPRRQVAQVAVAGYADNANTPLYGEIFAASVLLTVPLVVLALALQKHYVAGLASSGLK